MKPANEALEKNGSNEYVSWRRSSAVDLEASLRSGSEAPSSVSSIGTYYEKLVQGEVGPHTIQLQPVAAGSITRRRESSIASTPLTFSWQDVNVHAKIKGAAEKKQILFDVSGIVQPGQMVAILGASGSGKTTLMNALTRRNVSSLTTTGSIMINGRGMSSRHLSAVSAYVQQDDLFIGALTVREQLVFHALLRIPGRLSHAAKIDRADEVLVELGLRKCSHTKIGIPGIIQGISGGERKRLAFASAVLNNPSLLFCDEPTTGLDSYTAESVVNCMRSLTLLGKTILCTIHQPASEIYALFERSLLRLIFNIHTRLSHVISSEHQFTIPHPAPTQSGHGCPANYNPSDFIIELLSIRRATTIDDRARVIQICREYDGSVYKKQMLTQIEEAIDVAQSDSSFVESRPVETYQCNRLMQLVLMTYRSLLYNFRNPMVLYSRLVQKFLMGLLVALLYLQTPLNQKGIQNINGGLYYMCQQLIYPAVFGVLAHLPLEYPILCREHYDNMYTVWSWYLGKVFSMIPVYSTDGLVFMIVSYYIIGLRSAFTAFLIALLIAVMLEQTAAAFGTSLSAVSPNFPVAIVISGPILTVISMVGGLSANVGSLPPWISWARYISFYLYGFEAFTINQWAPITNITCEAGTYSCLQTGEEVLASLSFLGDSLWIQFAYMIGFIIVVHVIGYVGLLLRVGGRR